MDAASWKLVGWLRGMMQDFLTVWRPLVVYAVGFKIFESWMLIPLLAAFLSTLMARTGQVAVSNTAIVEFLFSPWGLLYIFALLSLRVAFVLLEVAGALVLIDRGCRQESLSPHPLWRVYLVMGVPVLRLAVIQLGVVLVAVFPFALAAGVVAGVMLTQYDIYYYWTVRPPVFWWAVGVGVVLALGAVAVVLVVMVRWVLALPLVLIEGLETAEALQASVVRTAGVRLRIVALTVSVGLVSALAGLGTAWVYREMSTAWLTMMGEFPIVSTLVLLTVQEGLYTIGAFLIVIATAIVLRRLALLTAPTPRAAVGPRPGPVVAAETWWLRPLSMGMGVLVVLGPILSWADWFLDAPSGPRVAVTAHRGHAHRAPENTRSALIQAIASGVDYVEIDVHQTRDGVIMLLHDRDLKRVAGVSRRLDELTYAETQALDVGRWFAPDFAGERLLRLDEAMALCRGKVKMNIEMKVYGPDVSLGPAVADLVHAEDFEDLCVLTSLSYAACQAAKARNPQVQTGFIVAQSLGDITRLNVDFYSIRVDHMTDRLVRTAHQAGRMVHVWTVKDRRTMALAIQRGADNLITSDPELAVAVRDDWAELNPVERLILTGRSLLTP